ncbi:hypothetical protein MASSI9I_60304 [Massilia sp. 9I]|nr:hypothetical protein MASSI9I_60304 [Massilia sp. 9I]
MCPSGTKVLDACTALRKTGYTNGFSLTGPLTAINFVRRPRKLTESLQKLNGRNSDPRRSHAQPEEHQPRPSA